MTHSYVWHDLSTCVTWHIQTRDMTHPFARRDSFMCVTWPVPMWDTTRSYVWCDSFICVTWFIHMRGTSHSYVCDMTRSYVTHDSVVKCVQMSHVSTNESCLKWVMSLQMSRVATNHTCEKHDSCVAKVSSTVGVHSKVSSALIFLWGKKKAFIRAWHVSFTPLIHVT